MSDILSKPPKPFFSPTSPRSGFALINPQTNQFARKFEWGSDFSQHVAISYVWDEWKRNPDDRLPSWPLLRQRLVPLLGRDAPQTLKRHTQAVRRCWVDCVCIDQDSPADKAFWIPRMSKVYSGAPCTLLLLRNGTDLSCLLPIARKTRCRFRNGMTMESWLAPHECLITQHCVCLPDLDHGEEERALTALEELARGGWRRRAWIFQEILLSEEYIISWADDAVQWMTLADMAALASGFSRKHPTLDWLVEFADWCRLLWYLRHFRGVEETSDANIIQLAANLQATVPADRYYCLCGILRLDDVVYSADHSPEEALHAVINALTRRGRLSWLHAVPASLRECTSIDIGPGRMAPFMLTRLQDTSELNDRQRRLVGSCLPVSARHIGTVTQVRTVRDVLDETMSRLKLAEQRGTALSESDSLLEYAALMIRRLVSDCVEPLLAETVSDSFCPILGIPNDLSHYVREIFTVLALFMLDQNDTDPSLSPERDHAMLELVQSASRSIRNRLSQLQDHYTLIFWTRIDTSKTDRRQPAVIGMPGCAVGDSVYAMHGNRGLWFAANAADSGDIAAFRGSLIHLRVPDILWHPSEFDDMSTRWELATKGPVQQLTFRIGE